MKKVYGIQGGKGSFNEQAVLDYLKRHSITDFEIKYLYTTENVLREVANGFVDYGQFAIHNSQGGIVEESLDAMSIYTFKVVEQFSIEIKHFLMKRKDVDLSEIKTVMAHPQVFLQCTHNMAKKYPNLRQVSGEGDLVDTAKAAQAVFSGDLEKTTAILGPKILSEIYNLDIIEGDLQDLDNNLTSFVLVERRALEVKR